MYQVTPRFLDVVAGSHRAISRVRVFDRTLFGAPPGDVGIELPLITGDVKLTSTSDVKGTISLTVPGDYWDVVQPYGAELFAERGIDFGDGTRELVPLGYFRINDVSQDAAPAGPIRIEGADRVAQMIQNRMLYPFQVPSGTTHRVIFERLVNGRATPTGAVSTAGYGMFVNDIVPIHWTGYDPDEITVPGGQVVEDSTYEFLAKLADARGCVLTFGDDGHLYVRPRERDVEAPPVYAIGPGEAGTLIRASRSVTRDGVYNIVSAYGSDPAAPTGYQLAYNNDVTSPLYWKGQFGAAPRYYASPVLRTDAAALEAASTLLARYTGLPHNLALFAVPNPALRPLDVVAATVGREETTHTIDEVTIPLVGGAPVEIATRQLNPVGVVETDPDPTPTPQPEPSDALPAHPGELLWIGSAGGKNHFNVGVGGASAHVDHSQAEIAGGYTASPQFVLSADKRAVQMRVQVNAKTTPGSTYPRVELRELQENGTSLAAWSSASGTHYMRGVTTVTNVAKTKPWVCIAQIHDAEDDVLRIQTEIVSGQLALVARLNDVKTTLLPVYTVGTPIDWRIDVVAGALTVKIGGVTKLTATMSNTGCYFKAGCYAQSNTSTENGDTSQFFSVELKNLVAWHTGYAEPTPPAYTQPTPGNPPPTGGDPNDGTQAATVLGWGPVVAGDEFAYTGPPVAEKWSMYNGPGHSGNGLRRPSAFSVANGILTCYGDAGGTTGGMRFKQNTKYVRIEWRARTFSVNPSAGGNRYHPVLLMWPTSMGRVMGGEYDFFETNCDSGQYGWFMHYPTEKPKVQEGGKFPLDIQNWHNYGFEWSRTGVRGFVDGVKKWEVNDSRMLSPDTMFSTIQLDNFYGTSMAPAKFEAQWVRIYGVPS